LIIISGENGRKEGRMKGRKERRKEGRERLCVVSNLRTLGGNDYDCDFYLTLPFYLEFSITQELVNPIREIVYSNRCAW
jgi:hypothetical protein